MVIAAPVNRSSTVEKYYTAARRYGQEHLSCGDQRLWEMIEGLRRCSTVGDALSTLLRIVHRAGQNNARKCMITMDKSYGSTDSICPRCGNRYKRHRDSGLCPGDHKNFVTDSVGSSEAPF